ncbi:hypothetical protein SAMN03159423_5809 [Bradyrhizobium sp. NFR13]|jgi:hypothetical protein|uniref:hypothetical protein n=1 Tax=Bradyrhizobium sp. NFR13 TaxID=1566285 RepID=UPI0008F15C21|nr:hypothetical protein [Bradyrhizobium sp. NFR13]SFM17758.1 hypothetical protein SAMN03159423_5809 [Bradyrhizobium sp. NFR13]
MTRILSIPAFAAALLVSAIAGGTARAEDEPTKVSAAQIEAFDTTLIGRSVSKAKTYACFIRKYDAEHLAAHPKQKVSAMKLLVTVEAPSSELTYSHSFRLGVKFRDRKGDFQSAGSCNHASIKDAGGEVRLSCPIDCEGGGIEIGIAASRKPQDKAAAMVRLEAVRIWDNDSKAEEETADYLKAGADDKAFRLERTSLKDCGSLVSDDDERIAMLGK